MARVEADPTRSPSPISSVRRASSSNVRPSVPPAPAVFSRWSGQSSDSFSASAITDAARSSAGATSVLSADPGCSTTPRAPSAAPMRNEVVSDASVFSRKSGSSDAGLSR